MTSRHYSFFYVFPVFQVFKVTNTSSLLHTIHRWCSSCPTALWIIGVGLSLMASSCQYVEKESHRYHLKIKGSESMHDAFEALKYDFELMQDSIQLFIEGGGSRTGLNAIGSREAHIGLSSFSFNIDSILGPDNGVTEYVVAYDGIVVVTHANNPVTQLTDDQITAVFTGRITDWAELGGAQGFITPIFRDQNSGTQRFFTEHFDAFPPAPSGITAADNSKIDSIIRKNPNAIGFVGFSWFSENSNSVMLQSTRNTFVAPTFANLKNNSYPLKRPLHIYYREGSDPALKPFMDYLNSDRAQAVFKMHGLMPLKRLVL